MTPAITLLKREKVPYRLLEYAHDPDATSFGREAAAKLGLDPSTVFKTLLAITETGELVVGIVPVAGLLDLKALAQAAGCRTCEMADARAAQRATGYLVGGISPLGQKKRLRTFIDAPARQLPTLYVSGGRRGLDIGLAPADLARLTSAGYAPLARAG
ncbi:MAG: Cys-tRNA(Pro) deacylase [Pseudoxanthomonas sp.]